jgi:Kef-type K+ transport system membrane component KefB
MLEDVFTGSTFNEVAGLLMLAAAVGFVGQALRQPLVVSYIAVGVIAGPSVLGIARLNEPTQFFAELGIAVLLFLVGIKLDIALVRTLGPVALATGLGQVIFTSVVGFGICLALGFDPITSLYIAVALTFSSTIIIIKLLSDKREIESLHGRIALGFLIVQDLVVVLAMIVLSAIGIGGAEGASIADVASVLGAGLALLVAVLLFVRFVANPLAEQLAKTPELLIGFAVALAACFAAMGDAFGFGKELGGLMAGVALASTPYREAIFARLAPLRDFLLLFFFIALGARLDLANLGESSNAALVLSLFVLIGNPLIVLLIMAWMGYGRRTGFLAGLTVAQISEFSFIFMAMGVSIGHVSDSALGLVTLVGLITIAASTYMITYSHELYALCEPALRAFRRSGRKEDASRAGDKKPYDAVIFGLGRYGSAIGRRLAADGWRVLGVDFNPEAIRAWRDNGLEAIYGDASDPEFLSTLPLASTRWAISTVREPIGGVGHVDLQLVMLQTLRKLDYRGRVAVTAAREGDVARLESAGPDLVFWPYRDAAEYAAVMLEGEGAPIGAPA